MRYQEFGGYNQYYSLEEEAILDKIKESEAGFIKPASLSERERQLVSKMVQKSMLKIAKKDDNKIIILNKGKKNK